MTPLIAAHRAVHNADTCLDVEEGFTEDGQATCGLCENVADAIREAVAVERAACAVLCESAHPRGKVSRSYADAIRARKP